MEYGISYKFCLLYQLIHLTSFGDAAALLWSNGYCHMISGGGWWEWGNIQCTVGAYSWPGDEWSRSSVLERAYCPTSAQCPQVGAFRFSHQILFFLWNAKSKLPPWCGGIKSMLCLDQSQMEHGKTKSFSYNFMHDEVLWVGICNDERHYTRTNKDVLTEFFAPTLSICNWHQMNNIQWTFHTIIYKVS